MNCICDLWVAWIEKIDDDDIERLILDVVTSTCCWLFLSCWMVDTIWVELFCWIIALLLSNGVTCWSSACWSLKWWWLWSRELIWAWLANRRFNSWAWGLCWVCWWCWWWWNWGSRWWWTSWWKWWRCWTRCIILCSKNMGDSILVNDMTWQKLWIDACVLARVDNNDNLIIECSWWWVLHMSQRRETLVDRFVVKFLEGKSLRNVLLLTVLYQLSRWDAW